MPAQWTRKSTEQDRVWNVLLGRYEMVRKKRTMDVVAWKKQAYEKVRKTRTKDVVAYNKQAMVKADQPAEGISLQPISKRKLSQSTSSEEAGKQTVQHAEGIWDLGAENWDRASLQHKETKSGKVSSFR